MTTDQLTEKVSKITVRPVKMVIIDHPNGGTIDLPELVSRYSLDGLRSSVITFQLRGGTNRHFAPASCKLIGMPGCCGMAVVSGLRVNGTYRRRGIGSAMLKYVEDAAREIEYRGLIATDITESNGPALLKSAGWEEQPFAFTNYRTHNTIHTFTKEL